ncbi:MAG: hypothetical protein IJU60_03215 [Acholeplasmatales bacterium]|nr:hypothetical protein [Acholeplasmatales bacterium]
MKKKILIRKMLCAITFLLMAITSFAVFTISTKAASENTISVKDAIVETNDSGIIVVEIVGEGNAGDQVEAFVRTEGGTAISGIDYTSIDSHIKMKYDNNGKASYKVSIKCLNTADNREQMLIFDQNNAIYGRYFNVTIYRANNAKIDSNNSTAKCYLPYNYKIEAVTGVVEDTPTWNGEDHSYIKEYNNVLRQYSGGIDDLDGRSTWRSWEHKMSFVNDTSTMWVNNFINTGLASAYGTFVAENIKDNNKVFSSRSHVKVYYGSREMIEKWDRDENCPGLCLYMSFEPGFTTMKYFKNHTYGNEYPPEATKYILIDKKNPYDKDDDLIDCDPGNTKITTETKQISWFIQEDTWFASKKSNVTVGAVKVNPYNGKLDTGVAAYNCREELDRSFEGVYSFLFLVDDKTPEIVSEFVDDSQVSTTGKLRFYIRFNEPVVSTRKQPLTVWFDNYSNPYNAVYSEGNYSDTLVYELDVSQEGLFRNIREIKYQLPSEDVGDMASNIDQYGVRYNNRVPRSITDTDRIIPSLNGAIGLMKPSLDVDLTSSEAPHNIYNLLVSINGNGEKNIKDGKLYYTWDKNENLLDPNDNTKVLTAEELQDSQYYANEHLFTEEENGSLTLTFTKSEKDKIDSGTYYLHLMAKSGYGFTLAQTFGPYVLDGEAPEINQINPTPNNLKEKTYTFEMQNKEISRTQIMNVFIVYKYVDKDGNTKEEKLKLYENSEKVAGLESVISEEPDTVNKKTVYKYTSSIDDAAAVKDQTIAKIIAAQGRTTFDVRFEVEDTAGNRKTSNIVRVVYDTRNLFGVTTTVPKIDPSDASKKGYTPIIDEGIVTYDAYDKSTVGTEDNEKYIYFTVVEANRSTIVDGVQFYIVINGSTTLYAGQNGEGNNYEIRVADLAPGFYEIEPHIKGTNQSTGDVDLIAENISFYITDHMTDNTANKSQTETNLVLNNKVFQLQDQRYYFLHENSSTVLSHPYGATYDASVNRSEGGSTYPTFSNINEAKKYVRFMEYQDLYLIKITANIANLLNGSTASTAYVKANGENTTAQEGQLWIRYKKNIWEDTANANGWAFYYYGSGNVEDGININSLPGNITDAINEVVNRITSKGQTVYLVTEETLDQKSGAPFLSSTQIHVNPEEATTSKVGSTFVSSAKYDGDKEIYKNKITIKEGNEKKELALATNMTMIVDPSTRIFYKYENESKWVELVLEEGKRLCELLSSTQASGTYRFREYGSAGICEYDVYFDKETPKVDVEIGNESQTLDGTILSYSGETFIIKNIRDVDDLAYIAIYSYPNRSLQNVLYASDVSVDNSYKLQDSNFYLQVGDRSGNNYTYTVLLSQTTLDVQVYENEAGTNVIVKVLERQESEIYSYEIYLNEKLVTTEFKETRVLKDPGVYRIVVRDIYGNEVDKTVEFASRTPEINWYYLNNESYVKYDPDKIVNMIIKSDPNSARVSNVYTSAMLRLTFVSEYGDGEIKFEMLDIDAKNYSYLEATNTITINSLIGFRLRVWFADTPENDRTYVVMVDNDAPTVGATFIGTTFTAHIERDNDDKIIKTSSFEALDLTDKNKDDVLSVNTLESDEKSATENSFTDGAVIRGGHIVLTFSDPSEIGKYTVAKDGQSVVVEPDQEGRLILNNYGEYVVTVSDKLGNTRVFRFTNTNDPVAIATVGEEILKENEEKFASGDVTLKLLYPGEARILIQTGTELTTYIFKYESGILTYGQYVCVVEQEKDDDGNVVNVKTAGYKENPDFSFDLTAETVIENREYDVLSTDNYIIKVIKIDNKPVLKFSTDKEVHLEMSYNAGKTVFPSYYIISLSKEAPEIRLLRGGVEIEIAKDSKYTYISETLTIDTNVNENITKIEVAYSTKPTFGKLETIYDGKAFSKYLEGTENGFYKIVVTNKYNNQSEYIIVKVDSFETIVVVTYKDESTREFQSNENPIYSNSTITFNVYSEYATFEIDGEKFEGTREDGVIVLEVFKEGSHKVRIIGGNEVTKDFDIVIGTNPDFVFNEEWLIGYNEEALLRAQAYTNLPLTVVVNDEIKYISYKYGYNDLIVLYDLLSEEKIADQTNLTNVIGQDGIGDYTIYFKNIYGDTASKVVHFRNIPQLTLSRKTTYSGANYEYYLLEEALVNNFYSNNILRFETTSTRYVFKIDGIETSLEGGKTLEFGNSSGNGSFEYAIQFLDEYGNYAEFKAELYRNDVVIDTSLMKEIAISNSTYTKDDIVITFSDNLDATVSFDDGQKKKYQSGTKFYKDGKYEFVVEDIAGNRNTYVINHKSLNHYTLTNSVTSQQIITGGVVNDSSVVFSATDDSKIINVFKNGQKMSNYTGTTFTTTGHWEVIIEDSIGNQSYDGFYIINNALVSFDYTAPYDYTITEVWLVKSKDNKELLNLSGESISLTKDGDYSVVVSNTKSATTMNFSVSIDTAAPTATLSGVEDGGITARDVSIKGLKSGDVVEIYKNGVLVSTTEVSGSNTAPEITTGGTYKVVIKSITGAQTEYNFTRKQIANMATSAFIIIACMVAVAGLTIGLLYHTKSKNDSEK